MFRWSHGFGVPKPGSTGVARICCQGRSARIEKPMNPTALLEMMICKALVQFHFSTLFQTPLAFLYLKLQKPLSREVVLPI